MTEQWKSRIVGSGMKAPGQLVANPKNYRTHPKAQQDALAGALDEVGWVQRVIVNKRTGHIVDGHARVELALERGEATVPVVYVDLNENEEGIVLAALDPLAAMAGVDQAKLDELLASITVDDEALRAMLKPDEGQGLTDPDDAPPVPEAPKTKPGDLYALGDHRLLCGDATKAEDVARLLDGAAVDLLIADPPYGVAVAGGTHDPRDEENYRSGGRIPGDDLADDALRALVEGALGGLPMSPGAAFYVWHASSRAGVFIAAVAKALAPHRQIVIWSKPNFVFSRVDYHYQHEPCLYGWVKGSHRWIGDRTQSTIWEASPVGTDLDKKQHPTAKPVELMERPIRNHEASAVYDPFVGSGTTIIAAERQGRRCYAMEIDPAYCDVTVRRWEEYTGKKASRG